MPALIHAATQLSQANAMTAIDKGAGAFTNTGIDLTGFEGEAVIVQNLGAITGSVSLLRVQDSADNSSFADVTGLTFGTTASAVTSVTFAVGNVRRYVRTAGTVTTGPAAISHTLSGIKKVKP